MSVLNFANQISTTTDDNVQYAAMHIMNKVGLPGQAVSLT